MNDLEVARNCYYGEVEVVEMPKESNNIIRLRLEDFFLETIHLVLSSTNITKLSNL